MHLLDFSTGDAAIAYRGATPWHGFGFAMEPGMPLEEWQKAARLDWTVKRRPVFTQLYDDQPHLPIESLEALVRSDSNAVLSVVGPQYKIVQPREVLEFFRDLIDSQGFELETAGALADGKRVWALAKTSEVYNLAGQDPIRMYLLLATSYDKKFSTTAQYTGVRVVCNNTLSIAVGQGLSGERVLTAFRVPHCTAFDADVAKAALGLRAASWEQFKADVELLSTTHVTPEQARRFFLNLTGFDEAKSEEEQLKANYLAQKLIQAAADAPGSELPTANGTLWGLVNAVTYFTDHKRRARDNGARLNSSWFGTSAQLKNTAWTQALAWAQKLVGIQ